MYLLMDTPQPGTVWRHYKGELYIVEFIALNADNDSMMEVVVYRRLRTDDSANRIRWTSTLHNWHAIVKDGVRRFEPHL